MKVEQLYTGCLAQGAYYIESDGVAAIVDPLRETAPYVALAQSDGASIRYILETHFHADFVSGHLDLARETGAKIVYGPMAQAAFELYQAADGEVLPLGKAKIKVLHTPGHTMESTTFLLIDEEGRDHALFTGDTLFIGDVGRPDLAVKSDLTREQLAGHLYDSLRNKIMPLADEVLVYPGHGAGSACGKHMSSQTVDTLGNQKRSNYALRADMTREEFVQEVTDGLVAPPQYFPKNAQMNKQGYESFDKVLAKGLRGLSAQAFEAAMSGGQALVLDTRAPGAFKEGFIPGSLSIGLNGDFAPWVGALISDLNRPILFVADPGREEEVVTRLARVGYDNPIGYLLGGLQAWQEAGFPTDRIDTVSAAELQALLPGGVAVLDVRKASEHGSEHLRYAGTQNLPLDFLPQRLAELQPGRTYYLHCAGGYRSVIAASLLKAAGYAQVVDVAGGFKALKAAGLPVSDYVCPTTML